MCIERKKSCSATETNFKVLRKLMLRGKKGVFLRRVILMKSENLK